MDTPRCRHPLNRSLPKIGCVLKTLNEWVKRVQVDTGVRGGVTTAEAQRVKALERENKELRRASETLKWRVLLCISGAGTPMQVLKQFIGQHQQTHGIEPICKVLQIVP